MLVTNIALKFFASITYVIIYLYSAELFPTNIRTTGFGICSMIGRVGAILGTYFNDNLVNDPLYILFSSFFLFFIINFNTFTLYQARIWFNLPVVLYGIISLIGGILALVFPDTSKKPLPQTVDDVERMDLKL